jgi:hypothetical protein
VSKEQINHPDHYNAGAIEVIDYIEDQGLAEGFCLGNAIKYISRAGKKDNESTAKDLKKAKWYIDRYIGLISKTEDQRKRDVGQGILDKLDAMLAEANKKKA